MSKIAANVDKGEKEHCEEGIESSVKHLKEKLHHSLRLCTVATKKAKLFETQRAIRRLKTASDEEKLTLQAELQELKCIDHVNVGAMALRAKLKRAKILSKEEFEGGMAQSTSGLLASFASELDSSMSAKTDICLSSSQCKAQSRLLSNKNLSAEVSRSVEGIQKLIGQVKDSQQEEELARLDTCKVEKPKEKRSNRRNESVSAANVLIEQVDQDGKEHLSEPSSKARKRSVSTTELSPMPQMRVKDVKSTTLDDRKVKTAELEAKEDNPDPALPLLSTGFVGGSGFRLRRVEDAGEDEDVWSDGDADLDSIDEEIEKHGERKEARKNRMGQRARRAIWEKKFGKGANHLKILEKDPKRVLVKRQPLGIVPRSSGERHAALPTSDAGWSGSLAETRPSTYITDPVSKAGKRSKAEMEVLHPSWIAKQQQRQKLEAIMSSNAKAAQKIVFD